MVPQVAKDQCAGDLPKAAVAWPSALLPWLRLAKNPSRIVLAGELHLVSGTYAGCIGSCWQSRRAARQEAFNPVAVGRDIAAKQ